MIFLFFGKFSQICYIKRLGEKNTPDHNTFCKSEVTFHLVYMEDLVYNAKESPLGSPDPYMICKVPKYNKSTHSWLGAVTEVVLRSGRKIPKP
jgi:hypothetical protein